MASHASTLLFLAVVVALASLASYLWSQWRARSGSETVAFAGLGLGTALMLAAVFLVVVGVLLLSHQWLMRLHDSAAAQNATAAAEIPRANPFRSARVEPSPTGLASAVQSSARTRAREQVEARPRSARWTEEPATTRARSNQLPEVQSSQSRSLVASASDPWAATRCVVPIEREWRDGTRWTIVNDCGVTVAIVIATCETPAAACPNGAWRYRENGLLLPAKSQRPTTETEETQYSNELRHAACVVSDSSAINLIGTANAERSEQWLSELEEARAHDACLSEVRRLAQLGARSGMPLEALLGATLYSSSQGQSSDWR